MLSMALLMDCRLSCTARIDAALPLAPAGAEAVDAVGAEPAAPIGSEPVPAAGSSELAPATACVTELAAAATGAGTELAATAAGVVLVPVAAGVELETAAAMLEATGTEVAPAAAGTELAADVEASAVDAAGVEVLALVRGERAVTEGANSSSKLEEAAAIDDARDSAVTSNTAIP